MLHDTQIKRLRHQHFFQRDCFLKVRVPRVRLPDGSVRVAVPDWVGRLYGFALLFEALAFIWRSRCRLPSWRAWSCPSGPTE